MPPVVIKLRLVSPVVANVTGPPTVIPPVDPVLPNTSVEAVMLSSSVWLSANPPVAPSVIAVDDVNGTNVTVWPDALTGPLTLMLSVCTVRLPPRVEAPSTVAKALVSCALPAAPLVLSDTAPVSALLLLVSVMVASVAEVVNDDVPPTVSTPPCVRLPTRSVTTKLPPTFEAPSTVALLLVRLALPLAPLVLSDAAPVSKLPVFVSVMVASVAEVVNDEVPATVKAPVFGRLPTVSVTGMLPPTFDAPSPVALLLVRLALPLAPLVLSDAAPVSRLALLSVMVAFEAEVVNDDVPVTVSTPLCVRLPSVLTTVRLPPTLDVSRTRPLARLLVRLALPVAPVVLSDAAPLSALPALVSVMSAFEAEVVNEDVPTTVRAPVCVGCRPYPLSSGCRRRSMPPAPSPWRWSGSHC